MRHKGVVSLAAIRNPWLDFPSGHSGKICEHFGGGGHRRVAAVLLKDDLAARAAEVLHRVESKIVAVEK